MTNFTRVVRPELERVIDRCLVEFEDELRVQAPFDTGRLHASIEVDRNGIRMVEYGAIQNSPAGQHTGWIERAINDAIRAGGSVIG